MKLLVLSMFNSKIFLIDANSFYLAKYHNCRNKWNSRIWEFVMKVFFILASRWLNLVALGPMVLIEDGFLKTHGTQRGLVQLTQS